MTAVAWGEAEKRSDSALAKFSVDMVRRNTAEVCIQGTRISFPHPIVQVSGGTSNINTELGLQYGKCCEGISRQIGKVGEQPTIPADKR